MADTANADDADLSGVSETMLQTLYARAKESRKPSHKIYDAKAMEVVGKLDYDFSAADKDATMSTGVIARTILLDAMVSDWLAAHPAATVVNIASGMDTRLYRIDGANVRRWYNVDLPEAIRVREHYLTEDGRVTNIACSAMDGRWADKVVQAGTADPTTESGQISQTRERDQAASLSKGSLLGATGGKASLTADPSQGGQSGTADQSRTAGQSGRIQEGVCEDVLVIVEGLSMYLSEQEVRRLLSIIDRHFPHVTVFFEILNPRFVHKDIEKSISQSGATFTFGAKSGQEIARLCPALSWQGDRSLVEGMEVIMPVYKVIGKIGLIRDLSNKIVVLKK